MSFPRYLVRRVMRWENLQVSHGRCKPWLGLQGSGASRRTTLSMGHDRHTCAVSWRRLRLYGEQECAMRQPFDSQTVQRTDPDLAEQAKPGHGVPSQDPDPAAQHPIDAAHSEAERKSAFVGAGVLAGAAAGAAVGTTVAGPVGVVVGGTLGAVAGAVGGTAAGWLHEAGEDQRSTTCRHHPARR